MLLNHPVIFIWLANLLFVFASAVLVLTLVFHKKSLVVYSYLGLLATQTLILINVFIFSYLKKDSFFFDSPSLPEVLLFGGTFPALMIYFIPGLFYHFNEIIFQKKLHHFFIVLAVLIFLKTFLSFFFSAFFSWNKLINSIAIILVDFFLLGMFIANWKKIKLKKNLFYNLLGFAYFFTILFIKLIIDMLIKKHPDWFQAFGWVVQVVFLLFGGLNFVFILRFVIRKLKEKNHGENTHFFEGTEREKEVALFILKGLSNKEIAEKLFVSENTVKKHIQNIYQKNNINNRVQLAGLFSGKALR